MNIPTRVLLPFMAAAAAACSPLMYGKIDGPSVAITQSLPPVPGAPLQPVAVQFPTVSFSIGNIAVGANDQDSSLTLNSATLAITLPSPGNFNFSGITALSLTIVPPAGSAVPEVTLAKFVHDSQSPQNDIGTLSPDGRTITLAAVEHPNLLQYLTQKTLSVKIAGSGTPPGPVGGSWTSDLTLDFHVIAQHNVL